MASVGYALVSTREQNLDAQTDALEAAACEKVFVEHASGVLQDTRILSGWRLTINGFTQLGDAMKAR